MVLSFLLFIIIGAAATMYAVWRYKVLNTESVSIVGNRIVKKISKSEQALELNQVLELRHHWISSVFYAGKWEFIAQNGTSLETDAEAKGIESVLLRLEEVFPGFSLAKVRETVSEGDVHGESLTAWRAA